MVGSPCHGVEIENGSDTVCLCWLADDFHFYLCSCSIHCSLSLRTLVILPVLGHLERPSLLEAWRVELFAWWQEDTDPSCALINTYVAAVSDWCTCCALPVPPSFIHDEIPSTDSVNDYVCCDFGRCIVPWVRTTGIYNRALNAGVDHQISPPYMLHDICETPLQMTGFQAQQMYVTDGLLLRCV